MKKVILRNHTEAIKEYLEKEMNERVTEIKHIGNFIFEAKVLYATARIITEPVDEEMTKIKILNINII